MSWAPKNILVPVDFSDESLAAVDTAIAVAGDPANVTALHVLQDFAPIEPGEVWYTIDEKVRKERTAKSLRDRLADAKYGAVKTAVAIGDAGHQISDHAKKNAVDLIVMPSHGRSGISRLLIGSVADRVIRLSHCPVLILRK